VSQRQRIPLLICTALALATLLAYQPAFQSDFVNFDDPDYVFANPHVGAGLTPDGVRWALTTFACGNWHPLTWLSLQLDRELYGGLKPSGFHLTNVLLHVANTLLLFGVLVRMTGAVWRSAVVAGLFALHPLHVESVAWVSERKDVLSTLCWMLTVWAYVCYVERPGPWRYLLLLVTFALGLTAKPMLVTLPCVLLLLDYWPLRRWPDSCPRAGSVSDGTATSVANASGSRARASRSGVLLEKLPLFALVLAACVLTVIAQRRGNYMAPLAAFPLTARVENALLAYVAYLGKMLWPLHLAVFYPHPGAQVPPAPALGAGLLLLVVTVLVLVPGRRWPYLAVGWLWYLGTLVPVLGLIQVGNQGLADRYTYIPLIGIFLLLTWGAGDLALAWRVPQPWPAATAGLILAACAALTWAQAGHWRSTLDLWAHAAAVTENNLLAHINLGTCYKERGMLSDAKSEFEKALTIDATVPEAHANLGNVLAELGRAESAAAEYRRAIRLAPGNALLHFNLGNVLAALGRPEEAVAAFREAIHLDAASAWPHNNLGSALRDLGRLEEALAEYRQALALDPAYALAHNNLGIAFAELGRTDEAVAAFRRALALDPRNAPFHGNLARVFQDAGRLDEALAEYRRALELGDKQAGPRLQACERLRALRPRLADLAVGRDAPADNAERLAFAELCRQPGEDRPALAARLYADAFSTEPGLIDSPGTGHRFRAACVAAAAGCGRGQDSARLGDEARARLRRQALDWLRADLAAWAKQAESARPAARAAVQQALRQWRRCVDLAGVRDPAALAQLPATEREAWQQLWREAAAAIQ
jgi:tetratricopeptide (TPR) repeat protein